MISFLFETMNYLLELTKTKTRTFSKNFLLEKVCLLFFIWNNELSFEERSKLVPKRFLFG